MVGGESSSLILPSFGQDSIRYSVENVHKDSLDGVAIENGRDNYVKEDSSSSEYFKMAHQTSPDEADQLEEDHPTVYEEKVTLKDGGG